MISNLIQLAINEKQHLIKLIVVFVIALFVLLEGWGKISNSAAYHTFNIVYSDFTVKIISSIAKVSDKAVEYNAETQLLSSGTKFTELRMPVEAYRYFVTGFILLLLVPIKQWISSVSAILFTLLFVALRAAIISYIFLFHYGDFHNVLLIWLDPVIFIPMLILGLYVVNNEKLLSLIYVELEKRFSEILNISLSSLLFLLIVLPPLPRVLFTYIHAEIMPSIVTFVLWFSKMFLAIMGRTAEIAGKNIYLDKNWVNLEYPCLGLGVFTLIAVLIFAVKADFKFKMIYLSVFALLYTLINSLRLSVLLLYINLTYETKGLNVVHLHDIATYFMYIVAFAGFWVYWSRVGKA